MQHLEVSGALRPIYRLLGVKRLSSCPTEYAYQVFEVNIIYSE